MPGPEDTPKWRKENVDEEFVVEFCVSCKKPIRFWHCVSAGCPWCALCGAKFKESM